MTELNAVKVTLSIMILLADRKLDFYVVRKISRQHLGTIAKSINKTVVTTCNLFHTPYVLSFVSARQSVLEMNFGRKNVCARPRT